MTVRHVVIMTEVRADIAIIGAGFGGSLCALIAKRTNHKVVLIERGSHPRFTIGESSTPIANLVLTSLVKKYDLPRLKLHGFERTGMASIVSLSQFTLS